jgi:epoxyqueuosine reductase
MNQLMQSQEIFGRVKLFAEKLGLTAIGICPAEQVAYKEALQLRQWIENGFHAGMSYMEQNIEKRLNPALMTPFEARSVIVMAMSYYFPENDELLKKGKYKISRYAHGKNYHLVMRKKLELFCNEFHTITGGQIKAYVDTSPVFEKYLAKQAGLGAIGKNTCLIIPGYGSWFFLTVCITDVEFEPDQQFLKDLCGSCTKCIETCPTGALSAPGILDARKCISYLTIEQKTGFDSVTPAWKDWIWGCDICQEVCPHNRKPHISKVGEFKILLKIAQLLEGTFNEDTFDQIYAGTSVKRGGRTRIPRNMKWVDNSANGNRKE